MKKVLLSFAAVCLLFFVGCSDEKDDAVPEVHLKSYQSGTQDGFFWSLWTSRGEIRLGLINDTTGREVQVDWLRVGIETLSVVRNPMNRDFSICG